MFHVQQVGKELMREKTRIFLTVLAITWGTFAISTMLAIGEGLRLTFAETVANTGHNLLMFTAGKTSKVYQGLPSGANINLTKKDLAAIAALPNVAMISPQYLVNYRLYYKNMTSDLTILAVASNYSLIHEIKMEPGGRFISPLDIAQKRAVVVLGEKTAEDLFPNDRNPVGKTVAIGNKPFLVIGVMQHKSQIVAHEAPDAFDNWIPISTYELYANPQVINSLDLSYKDARFLEDLKQQIQHTIALNHAADPTDSNIITITEYAKREQEINNFFLGMQIFLGIVGALTLVVAGVGIANVMFASVHRSTNEIGLRKALGAKTYQILIHYVFEALMATFLGGVLGLGLSALLVQGLQKIPMQGKLIEAIGQPRPVLSLSVLIIVVAILGLIGFLAGFFPALKAAKIDPARALAYE